MADDGTANQLLDYLASDGYGGEWTCYADLADWESLYNLLGEPNLIGRLARNLADRRPADVWRPSVGMQLQLPPMGEAFASTRKDCLRWPWPVCRNWRRCAVKSATESKAAASGPFATDNANDNGRGPVPAGE